MAGQILNALDVLFAALPNADADQLQSQLRYTPTFRATTQTRTTQAVTTTTFITSSTSISSTSGTSSLLSSTLSSTISSSILSSSTTASASTSTSATASAAQNASPTPTASKALSGGAIAGVVTGVIAALVIIALLLLWIFKLRKKPKQVQGHSRSPSQTSLVRSIRSLGSFGRRKEKPFPESAWLYDPQRPYTSVPPPVGITTALGSNAPWEPKPGPDGEAPREAVIQRPLSTLAELPAVSSARGPHTRFPVRPAPAPAPEPENDDGPRRFSYPIKSNPWYDAPDDGMVSPLVTAAPERMSRYYSRLPDPPMQRMQPPPLRPDGQPGPLRRDGLPGLTRDGPYGRSRRSSTGQPRARRPSGTWF